VSPFRSIGMKAPRDVIVLRNRGSGWLASRRCLASYSFSSSTRKNRCIDCVTMPCAAITSTRCIHGNQARARPAPPRLVSTSARVTPSNPSAPICYGESLCTVLSRSWKDLTTDSAGPVGSRMVRGTRACQWSRCGALHLPPSSQRYRDPVPQSHGCCPGASGDVPAG